MAASAALMRSALRRSLRRIPVTYPLVTPSSTRALTCHWPSRIPLQHRLLSASSSSHLDRSSSTISLYDMDAFRIRNLSKPSDIESLVTQLERLPSLTSADIGPLVLPLTRVTSDPAHGRRGAEWTERILLSLLSRLPPDRSQRSKDSPYPPTAVYNRAMIAWGNLRSQQGAHRAQRIFQLLLEEYAAEPDRAAAPCRRSYKSLLRAWAVSSAPDGPAQALAILRDMQALSGVGDLLERPPNPERVLPNVQIDPPDRTTYNTVLSAYAKTFVLQHPHAIARLRDMVSDMDQLYAMTGDDEYRLDRYSYHSLLRAYSRYAAYAPPPLDVQLGQEIAQVLQRMQAEPDWQDYDNVLSLSWAFGVQVEALVKTLPVAESLSQASAMVLAMAQSGDGSSAYPSSVYPRHDTLIKLVRAWERSGLPEAQQRMDELIRIAVESPMERIHLWNVVMEEWTRSGWEYAPELVEKMLERAWQEKNVRCKPTGQTFAIAIKAWLRCKREEAAHRAELLFQKMLHLYEETKDSYYCPRDEHVRFVMTGWVPRCGTGKRYDGLAGHLYPAEHTEAFLQWLRGEEWIANASGHYSMAIRAWAKQVVGSGDAEPNPVQRAVALLDQLGEITGALPAFPCNWVLEACRRSQPTIERRKEAYNTAIDTFRRGQHNARTFVLMVEVFKAQAKGIDESHATIIEELFQECCSCGMLTQDMIWHTAEVASAEALQRLFGVSYQYANFLVQVRGEQLNVNGTLGWKGNPPSALLTRNLPNEWSRKANTGRKEKAHRSHSVEV